jgi:uncharacterized protein YrrD
MELRIGTTVIFPDGDEVVLSDVVIDPHAKKVSHVVAQPRRHPSEARLVPIDDVASTGDDTLVCVAAFDAYPPVEMTRFVKMSEPIETTDDWDVGIEHAIAYPYYAGDFDGVEWAMLRGGADAQEIGVTFHRIPKGEVEIRRQSEVLTSDDERVGTVDGFLLDDDHVTHVVLEKGHWWGRHEIAIPVSAVAWVRNDAIRLDLTADEVAALPRPRTVTRP